MGAVMNSIEQDEAIAQIQTNIERLLTGIEAMSEIQRRIIERLDAHDERFLALPEFLARQMAKR